jgi:hypothetical protein
VLTCRSAPQLQDLDLRFNPVRQHKAYSVVLSALTRLSQLDRAPVLTQQQGLQAGTTDVTAALLRERATLWHSNSGKLPGQPSCTVPSDESWIEVVLTPSAEQCTLITAQSQGRHTNRSKVQHTRYYVCRSCGNAADTGCQ